MSFRRPQSKPFISFPVLTHSCCLNKKAQEKVQEGAGCSIAPFPCWSKRKKKNSRMSENRRQRAGGGGGGFKAAYQNAAAEGTAMVQDDTSGIQINHSQAAVQFRDPTKPFRQRVAARIAAHLNDNNCVLDVGCATAGDLCLVQSAIQRKYQQQILKQQQQNPLPTLPLPPNVQYFGVDLLAAQLEVALQNLPEGMFLEGTVTKLPFPHDRFDVVFCSRLLIHQSGLDFKKSIDEMIRIMKPGGFGICCEGDMDVALHILTSDDRLRQIFDTKNRHVQSMCATPRAASETYRYLLSHPQVNHVSMDSFSCVLPSPTAMGDPDLTMDRQFLSKLVETGKLQQKDMDYYVEQVMASDAAELGNCAVAMLGPFEISFYKTTES